jgi:hypothetical protein
MTGTQMINIHKVIKNNINEIISFANWEAGNEVDK